MRSRPAIDFAVQPQPKSAITIVCRRIPLSVRPIQNERLRARAISTEPPNRDEGASCAPEFARKTAEAHGGGYSTWTLVEYGLADENVRASED